MTFCHKDLANDSAFIEIWADIAWKAWGKLFSYKKKHYIWIHVDESRCTVKCCVNKWIFSHGRYLTNLHVIIYIFLTWSHDIQVNFFECQRISSAHCYQALLLRSALWGLFFVTVLHSKIPKTSQNTTQYIGIWRNNFCVADSSINIILAKCMLEWYFIMKLIDTIAKHSVIVGQGYDHPISYSWFLIWRKYDRY